MLLCNKIPASMKQEEYDVKVAYTKSGIVACECGCKAGSKGLDKVLCVHVLPVLMQFLVFFIDDLGQNILIEMCNRWNADLDEISRKDSNIKQNIIQMMEVIGCSNQELAKAKVATSIKDVLEDFCVGTEKKKKIPLPPREDLLCPLRHLKIKSTNNSLGARLKNKRRKKTTPIILCQPCQPSSTSSTTTMDPTVLPTDPKYQNVLLPVTCDICKDPQKTSTHVCTKEMANGPRLIQGSSTRICGISTCITCKMKSNMTEDEIEARNVCPFHCKKPKNFI